MTNMCPFAEGRKQTSGGDQTLEAQYIQGYQRYPETEEEIAYAKTLLPEVWAEVPWDEPKK